MGKKIARISITLLGVFFGLSLVWLIYKNRASLGLGSVIESIPLWGTVLIYGAGAVLFGVVFFILAPLIINAVIKLIGRVEKRSSEFSMQQIVVGVAGLLVGLIIALLVSFFIAKIPLAPVVILLDIIVFVSLGYLGFKIPTTRIKEFNLPNWFRKGEPAVKAESSSAKPKILDTSAIIDGRFFDVYKTGIVEGGIIVPEFVLDELRHIADSADPLKRARGRRGLDAINALKEDGSAFRTVSADYPDLDEVDTKLLRLALDMNGVVVTNDYNLGKVAAVQAVPVFNINDLANALRLSVVAGEVLELTIVKEGKEHGQGVAYFDDGTMVVVDGAAKLVGETVTAVVTSVLQTSAGRMVFAKVAE